MNQETYKQIDEHKLLALIRTTVPEDSEALIGALLEGGIRLFGVSVSIPQSYRLIENLAKKEGVLVGASSVLDGEVAQRAINAGAKFVMSPYTDKDVILVCKNSDALVIQSALTPTEVMDAVTLGVDIVEVYPVDLFGGSAYIKALKGPLPSPKLIPSGGITLDNAMDYIKMGVTAIVLSDGILEKSLIRADSWDTIRDRAKQLVEKVESLKAGKNN